MKNKDFEVFSDIFDSNIFSIQPMKIDFKLVNKHHGDSFCIACLSYEEAMSITMAAYF